MIKRGTVVNVQGTATSNRKARRAQVHTAVALADAFEHDGVWMCPVGFYSPQTGPWAQVIPVIDLLGVVEAPPVEMHAVLPRSYRPEYRIWMAMRQRCSAPRNQNFHAYGGRVQVCPEWAGSFDQFYQDMGSRPSPRHSLDRINNEGDYKPGNVRWATPQQQSRNTSRTRFITAFGQTKPLTQWAEQLGITPQSLVYRIDQWGIEAAVSRPESKHQPYKDSLESQRKRGAGHHLSKLDDSKVINIRRASKAGESTQTLAARYSVSYGTINYIIKGRTWSHVRE